MISIRSISNFFGDPERSALDLPVAGLAALAVAFAAFTVPDALLGRAVEATGLPSLLTAAQPPLGNTARLLMAVVGAATIFTAAFALLRWLDRFAARGPVRSIASVETPRVHRADAHPDAPPRRPISAARDLGEPAPPSLPEVKAAVAAEPVQPERKPELSLPTAAPESLGALMARLERGLARREGDESAAPIAPPPVPAASNDRLQSAIEGLRALATRA